MIDTRERDPRSNRLNMARFRGKFHIYEIRQMYAREAESVSHVVAKQLLERSNVTHGAMQPIVKSKKHTLIGVGRDDLLDVYNTLDALTIPLSRIGHCGCDGEWCALQIGAPRCDTVVRWWSDSEPQLESAYRLRDIIVETINRIIRLNTLRS